LMQRLWSSRVDRKLGKRTNRLGAERNQVLPLTEPTKTNADPGESRERRERCSKRNKGERFFIILSYFFTPTFQNTCSLISYPSAFVFPTCLFPSQYIKKQHSGMNEISVIGNSYKCVCSYSRQAAAASVWIQAASFSVVLGIAADSTLFFTSV
jgi:hypothetical protein